MDNERCQRCDEELPEEPVRVMWTTRSGELRGLAFCGPSCAERFRVAVEAFATTQAVAA